MKVLRSFLFLAISTHLLALGLPQRSDPHVAKLQFLVGDWTGTGWIKMGNQPRSEFKSEETIEMAAGGNALLIRGLHKASEPDGSREFVVHDALAVVSWNEDHYAFQSWLANGRRGNYRGQLLAGAFVWEIEIPQYGTMRYTITVDEEGRWLEIGEISRDGGSWIQFFEMKLTKT